MFDYGNKKLKYYYLVVIVFMFIFSSYFVYKFSKKQVEDSFLINKNIVAESLTQKYSQFINTKLPIISLYNGYLDSTSIQDFVNSTFKEYDFVKKIVFYDTYFTFPKNKENSKNLDKFKFNAKQVLEFERQADGKVKTKSIELNDSLAYKKDFEQMSLKFNLFVEQVDSHKFYNSEAISNNFFSNTGSKITYMNIPRTEDIQIYKDISLGVPVSVTNDIIQQDIVSVYINQKKLTVQNAFKDLYESITVTPAFYKPILHPDSMYTSVDLPGSLSDYQLNFVSSRTAIHKQEFIYFLPLAFALAVLYSILIFIAYLIFKDIQTSAKMFKFQYDFINNLTHEFKTPVSVIKIAGNNLRQSKLVNEQERSYYAKILEEESEKLNQLMNKILSFTQIENRSIQVNVDEIDINEFIISTIDVFQVKYPEFEITYQVAENAKMVYTDAILLGSLFDNLFENAYKYSPVNRKKLHILAQRNKNLIVLSFKDQGIGIMKTELNNIFKKFYRIESKYNQNGSVGLGLAFCKEVALLLGGEITVNSQLGEGSEFIITLPIQ